MGEKRNDSSENHFLNKLESGSEEDYSEFLDKRSHQDPPNPIPNRPLRGEKRRDDYNHQKMKQSHQISRTHHSENRSSFRGRGGRTRDDGDDHHQSRNDDINDLFTGSSKLFVPNSSSSSSTSSSNSRIHMGKKEEMYQTYQKPGVQFSNSKQPMSGEKRDESDDKSVSSFLEKLNLSIDDEKKENKQQFENPNTHINLDTLAKGATSSSEQEQKVIAPQQPAAAGDADEIFKKMKETGLIPNAVAMLDGLCKDGLVQEAMKLFGLMREKGTIPEVVIYTAVVEGFCKARKLDDAKRIFRKMQNNGISPNAFSYTVLIQGLLCNKSKCEGMMRRLDDAVDFCVEMLEAGHSPNVVTFVSFVDGFVTEKGVEEANNVIGRLREKGFFVNEKAVRDHLDKNGPFSSLVWEAIFGKKSSQRAL